MPKARTDLDLFLKDTDRLIDILNNIKIINPYYRKLVCELIFVRLFFSVENSLQSIFAKLTCGATYLDGTNPVLLHQSGSMKSAVYSMETLGRTKRRNLRWTEGAEIRKNVMHVIDSRDNCYRVVVTYSPLITELRYVRNHIAHQNESTRRHFRKVVRSYYGGYKRGVNAGTLLTSQRISTPPLIESYIRTTRVFIRDLTRA